jgi:hypothetical protein
MPTFFNWIHSEPRKTCPSPAEPVLCVFEKPMTQGLADHAANVHDALGLMQEIDPALIAKVHDRSPQLLLSQQLRLLRPIHS